MVTLTLGTAGPPKRQIIELAFGDIGSAGYEFGRTPEEINDALLRLNALMREWPFSTLGYVQPDYGVGSADDLSGIPDEYLSVVAAKLALRICPMMGATLSVEAKANLATGMALLQRGGDHVPHPDRLSRRGGHTLRHRHGRQRYGQPHSVGCAHQLLLVRDRQRPVVRDRRPHNNGGLSYEQTIFRRCSLGAAINVFCDDHRDD
jgi:hypothetical protein